MLLSFKKKKERPLSPLYPRKTMNALVPENHISIVTEREGGCQTNHFIEGRGI